MALNIADLFEHAVDVVPDNPALKVLDRVVTYAELERESNKLAHYLASQGVAPGDHVGIYAKNSVEHVIAVLAVVKIRAVNINVNYRYVEGELNYLFDNADVKALIFERPYAPIVANCAPKHAQLTTFVSIPDVTDPDNDADISSFGGVTLEDATSDQSAERDFDERSNDDLHIIYTGGTTGFPKGVMWRHEDFWRVLGGGIDFYTGEPLEEFDQSKQATDPRMVTFPLSPLMHGGAQAGLLMHLFAGHLTILEPKFDAQRTWEIIDANGVQLIFMTGDAMARPLIEEFERQAATGIAVRRLQPVRDLQQCRDLQPAGEAALDGGLPERRVHRLGRRLRDRLPGDGPAGQGPHQHRRPGRRARPQQRGHRRRQPRPRRHQGHRRRSAGSAAAARCRSATTRTPRSRPRRSSRSTASATRCPATSPGSRRTARSPCSAAAPTASTPAGRRSTPKRWRWRSRATPACTTCSWSACPTRSTASR